MFHKSMDDSENKDIFSVKQGEVYALENVFYLKPKLLKKLGQKNQLLEIIDIYTQN